MSDPKIWPYYNGRVILEDSMGNDLRIVNAAKVSFNNRAMEMGPKEEKLIKYLAEHKHMSPFRHVQFTFTLEGLSKPILMQLYKHQVGIGQSGGEFREVATPWNEVSGRYVEFEEKFFEPTNFRPQHKNNKQASVRGQKIDREDEARFVYQNAVKDAYNAYKVLLELGVCKEQARFLLPQALESSVIWTASLEACVHFVKLRTHESAQVEIQELAEIIYQAIEPVCPIAVKYLMST